MVDSFQFELFDDPSNRILAATDYSEFHRLLSEFDCRKCSLAGQRTNIVIDRGNPESKVLLIGEGPGQQEDLQGRAFVGRAGLLLDEIMKAVDLSTEKDMLIANVVKCRPPNNRDPLPSEVAACEPFLHRQIALLQPRLILAVGRIAAQNLLKTDASLADLRRRCHYMGQSPWPVVVTYHPAYLLRQPLAKRKAWQDLCFAMEQFHTRSS